MDFIVRSTEEISKGVRRTFVEGAKDGVFREVVKIQNVDSHEHGEFFIRTKRGEKLHSQIISLDRIQVMDIRDLAKREYVLI